MAISKDKLLKDLLPGLNDMFKYGVDYPKLIDQIIHNEAIKLHANKLEEYQALQIDQIIHNEAVKQKELEDAIQEQSR